MLGKKLRGSLTGMESHYEWAYVILLGTVALGSWQFLLGAFAGLCFGFAVSRNLYGEEE